MQSTAYDCTLYSWMVWWLFKYICVWDHSVVMISHGMAIIPSLHWPARIFELVYVKCVHRAVPSRWLDWSGFWCCPLCPVICAMASFQPWLLLMVPKCFLDLRNASSDELLSLEWGLIVCGLCHFSGSCGVTRSYHQLQPSESTPCDVTMLPGQFWPPNWLPCAPFMAF